LIAQEGAPDELVVLLDDAGVPIGTAPKSMIHGTDTPLHLAFSCHVFAPGGDVLMTRRSLTKRTFPGDWTNAFCGHPLPGEDLVQAVHRRAAQELGLELHTLILVLPTYRYTAVDSSGILENEICPVFVGTTDTRDLSPDRREVEDQRWCSWESVTWAARHAPWLLSPWAAEQVCELASLELPLVPTKPEGGA